MYVCMRVRWSGVDGKDRRNEDTMSQATLNQIKSKQQHHRREQQHHRREQHALCKTRKKHSQKEKEHDHT